MVNINIDNKVYQAGSDKNLLEVCLSAGLELPYFCYHPALGSVGACRQCAVKMFKDEHDKKGKIIMACMQPVHEGMLVSANDPEVKKFREHVIESLMTNHPHDCPVCDEGGECHLQDMTVMTGHAYRHFQFKKRTYKNQNLGPFVNHEMNRCIQCYRCVRFYRDYAGGKDLNVFGSHNHVYFGRHEDGTLESEFSGNLAEVCPTGVFTDKTLKHHYTRKWDLTSAPSVCHHCGLGCNTIASERYGSLRRIQSRYNGEVNGYFICDRGRFGYEFVNSKKRISVPLLSGNGNQKTISRNEALNYIKNISQDKNKLIGIGSPRASLESNFALRAWVGENNFYHGVPEHEYELLKTILDILRKGPARSPSMKETEKADAVFILGEDLINTAPMLALSLHQSVHQLPEEIASQLKIYKWNDIAVRIAMQDHKGPLFIATPDATKMDDIATQVFRAAPDDIARLGFAVANILNKESPVVNNLSGEMNRVAENIAGVLKSAKNPLIISGTSCGSKAMLHAAANITWALDSSKVNLSFVVPDCNSLGLAMMEGKNIKDAFDRAGKGEIETVAVLENNIYRYTEKESADNFFNACKNIIVFDHLESDTSRRADLVIPVGSFAEADGMLVNNEGRAQRFYQVYTPDSEIQESWRWIREVMMTTGKNDFSEFKTLDDFTAALVKSMPAFEGIQNIAPPPGFRIVGEKIPRETARYSGRTAMHANVNVSEPKPPEDPDSALSFTMEGYKGKAPSSIIPFYWSPGWNSVQAINKYQIEVGGPLHGGDPGKRLIEPLKNAGFSFFKEVPEPFAPREREWLALSVYHIFGSEEMSAVSPAVSERIPNPYLSVNSEDAKKLNIAENDLVEVSIKKHRMNIRVKLKKELPAGTLGIPVGLPGIPVIALPGVAKISITTK
jgi:NADH-quinone oxidoreductase subunit G